MTKLNPMELAELHKKDRIKARNRDYQKLYYKQLHKKEILKKNISLSKKCTKCKKSFNIKNRLY